jgi:membrane protein implicated in regulation of membrane protease activity
MAIVWLVLGVLCLAAETHHRQFYLVFAAVGAFIAALVALFAPSVIAGQVAAAAVFTAAGILVLRPRVVRLEHQAGGSRVGRGVHGTLVGEEVITLDTVGDAHQPGHVRLAGERWLAVNTFSTPIPPGTRALVVGVRGTTLQVSPLIDTEQGELL